MGEIQKEIDVLKGEETKDKHYSSENEYSDHEEARQAFRQAVTKLMNVNQWSELPGLTSTFQLYDRNGAEKHTERPEVKDYMKIILPGPVPENWVVVTDIREAEDLAEFTVSPSSNPTAVGEDRKEIKHFFVAEATSTFRVRLQGITLVAEEIGKNEGINNQGKEAADRELINTLIAEGGWAGFQKFQWEKLTDYLVHKVELS